MEEIWKDIDGYEGLYQVSNLGQVKGLDRLVEDCNGCLRKINGRTLKLHINKNGYLYISLRKNGNSKIYKVHQLVAIAFLNHTPCGMKYVVDHIDDNKLNNRFDNLQITTQRFNTFKTQGKYSSKYKGVYWEKRSGKWHSQIYIDGKQKHLGYFKCELAAAHAYNKALKNLVN